MPASKPESPLCLVLFADWISAKFSLTLELLSLQSPQPLFHPKTDTPGPVSFPLLLVFRVWAYILFFFQSFFLPEAWQLGDRFAHLCHCDGHHGPCLPASGPGDGAAKCLWGIFIALLAKHLLPITQRGQL